MIYNNFYNEVLQIYQRVLDYHPPHRQLSFLYDFIQGSHLRIREEFFQVPSFIIPGYRITAHSPVRITILAHFLFLLISLIIIPIEVALRHMD